MSLLTDALRLREGRRPSRGGGGPSFPPFHGPRPGRWLVGVLVVCVLGVLGWWKGGWLVEKVEVLAGVAPAQPAPNLLTSAPRKEPSLKGENVPGQEATRRPEAPAVPATAKEEGSSTSAAATHSSVPQESAPENEKSVVGVSAQVSSADRLISPEGKKQGEILLTDSFVKNVAEKPAVGSRIPDREVSAAALPAAGLQPMKVELAEEEMVVASPQEREKMRTEAVEEFLRGLRVQGVRLQGAESRILVDGAPIGLGEKLGALGLVLESVEPQKIIFSDALGKKYPKSY